MTSNVRRLSASVIPGLVLASIWAAPGMAADEKPGRYTMSPTEGGFVRLDTETGEMALCKRAADGGWACEAMPDSQQAMRRDLDRLKQENESLRKNDQAAAGPPATPPPSELPPLPEPEIPGSGDLRKIPIPTEQDVDKLFDYVEGMVKKLKDRIKRLEDQNPDKGPGTPL
ncbi:MAG: hypothetical protein ACT4N2_05150 [Hyphomicrobium sp.]